MEIHTGKEVINKTEEEIPALVQIIKTKEQELKNILVQEKIDNPFDLTGKAYKTFQTIRKEILATLHILDKLGYKGKEGVIRNILKVGPFTKLQHIDYNSPKQKRELKKSIKQQEEFLRGYDLRLAELNKKGNELDQWRVTI